MRSALPRATFSTILLNQITSLFSEKSQKLKKYRVSLKNYYATPIKGRKSLLVALGSTWIELHFAYQQPQKQSFSSSQNSKKSRKSNGK